MISNTICIYIYFKKKLGKKVVYKLKGNKFYSIYLFFSLNYKTSTIILLKY